MDLTKLEGLIEGLINDDNVLLLNMYYKRPKFSMAIGLTPMEREGDVKKLIRTWKRDRAMEVYVEMIRKGGGFPVRANIEIETLERHDVVDLESEYNGDDAMDVETDGNCAVGVKADGDVAVGREAEDDVTVGGETDVDDAMGVKTNLSSSLPIGVDATINEDGAAGFDFDEYEETEGFGPDDEEDHNSVDGVSFCSDRVDEEFVSMMKEAKNLTDTAATHGPETDAISKNRRELNQNISCLFPG